MRSLALLSVVAASAAAQPAPRPPGWPSDFCLARGADAANPACGTCSTSSIYATPELGVAVQWLCKDAAGQWLVHGFTRRYGAPYMPMSSAEIAAKGLYAAWWDSNTVPASATDAAATSALIEANKYGLARVVRPPDPPAPPPASWVVSPVSTGLRPSYVLSGSNVVRESGKYIPTITSGSPTPCACTGSSSPQLCAVVGYLTDSGAQRYASCVKQ